jgi:hypothetical protein
MSLLHERSLVELLNNAVFIRSEDRRSGIQTWIRDRMAPRRRIGRNWAFGANFLEMRRRGKVLGQKLGQAIRDQDSDAALELINDSVFRRFRNNGDFANVLNNAFNDRFFNCEDCGEIMHADGDDIRWVYHDTPICQACADSDYQWSERMDTYVRNSDYENHDDYCEDNDGDDSIIGEYHSSNPRHIPSEYDKRKPKVLIGLELEVEINDRNNRESKAQELIDAIQCHTDAKGLDHRYCQLERDGSLDYGFEIVTGFTGLDVHRKQLEFFKNPWSGVRSHNTSTCGLHVHICKSDMTLYHGAKLILFINDEKNHSLIKALARRTESGYAKIKNKKDNIVWLKNARETRNPLNNLNADRYEALNFQNPNTIEFRLFKGTLRYETIQACLEFSFLSWHFTRNASIKDLTIEKFLEFINKPENRSDSIYLRSYLEHKGFNVFVPNKKTA